MNIPRVQRQNGSDHLGRYYTKHSISQILVDQMFDLSPRRILDLGSGGGALALAAHKKWKNVELLTVDIDAHSNALIEASLESQSIKIKHQHLHADALSNTLPSLLKSRRKIDVGVCNPPFLIPQWQKGFSEILEDAGFSGCLPAIASIDAALLFLAQNLRLLNDGGTLGIILPDSLISAARYKRFRHELLTKYHIKRALRLPRGSFLKTDALAHILVIQKCMPLSSQIPLFRFEQAQQLSPPLSVTIEAAAERLEYEYHAANLHNTTDTNRSSPLGSLGVEITRGNLSSAQARLSNFPIFHTTDIASEKLGQWCNLQNFCTAKSNKVSPGKALITAAPGDILIARIGRNLEQKIIGVASGFPALTDCVLKLSVPPMFRQQVLTQLTSEMGQSWLKSRTYGVSARQITMADILKFPFRHN